MDPMEYDEMLRSLVTAIQHQGAINDDLRTCIQEQRAINEALKAFNHQQVEINQDVKTTLARIETLLARMIQQSENGRDA